MSGLELPCAPREQIASAIDIVVHESTASGDGSRKVTCISEVVGLEG
jgi:Flp pilus assembly CpaF family ATPase